MIVIEWDPDVQAEAAHQQGGVGHLKAGQIDDHSLEIEQTLQTALGDLRLVRGVLGCPVERELCANPKVS